jgi:hypothetical protein
MDYDPADRVPTARQAVAGWLACAAIALCAFGLPTLSTQRVPHDPSGSAVVHGKAPALCPGNLRLQTLGCRRRESPGVIARDRAGQGLHEAAAQPCS